MESAMAEHDEPPRPCKQEAQASIPRSNPYAKKKTAAPQPQRAVAAISSQITGPRPVGGPPRPVGGPGGGPGQSKRKEPAPAKPVPAKKAKVELTFAEAARKLPKMRVGTELTVKGMLDKFRGGLDNKSGTWKLPVSLKQDTGGSQATMDAVLSDSFLRQIIGMTVPAFKKVGRFF